MSRPARIRFWPVILLALAGVVLPLSPLAAQQPSAAWLQGTDAFRYMLHVRGFKPLNEFDNLFDKDRHGRTMLIVFGDTVVLEKRQSDIRSYVEAGGALFVATDHEVPGIRNQAPTWAGRFGIQFFGQPVLGIEESSYQGNEQCPYIDPAPNADPDLFVNLRSQVAANRSGHLRIIARPRRTHISVLAMFPKGNWHNGFRGPERHFAAGGHWLHGKVLFLADHSVFINNMMLQDDLGNAGFTYNCLDWLRIGPNGPRDQILFYDDGNIVENFDVPVDMPPLRFPDDPVNLANQVLAGLESEDMHNRLLLDYFSIEQILAFLTIVLTSLLGVYLIRRLWRSRFRLEPGAPLLAPTLARYSPMGSGLSQRHRALLADGNLWEPARAMARDFFETALGTHEPPQTLPAFQASEGWLTRRFLGKLLPHLWRLAYGKSTEKIPAASFAHLAAQMDELKAALSDGSLRFQTPATS
jgi:hypothetical protein